MSPGVIQGRTVGPGIFQGHAMGLDIIQGHIVVPGVIQTQRSLVANPVFLSLFHVGD